MGYFGAAPGFNQKLDTDLDMNSKDITGTGNISVVGTLQGGVKVEDSTDTTVTVTATQCYGSILQAKKSDGGQEYDLPAVVAGMFLTIVCTEAQIVTIDPNASDRIIFNGTAKADGVAVASAGNGGETLTLYGDSADGWTVVGMGGTWS